MFTHQNIYGHMDTHTRVHLDKHMSTQTLASLLFSGFSVFSVKWTSTYTQSNIQYNLASQNSHYLSMHCFIALRLVCI